MAGRRPTRDEIDLFGKVVADAAPLASDRTPTVEVDTTPEPEPPPKALAVKQKPKPSRALESRKGDSPQEPAHLDRHTQGGAPHGRAPGLDRRLQLRLKRGQLPIEARLDLHGLGREKARAMLNGFIAQQAALGRRCVLVITGKGRPDWQRPAWGDDTPEAGVIRRALPEWLRDSPNKDRVLAFAPAQPRDGGAGAWYVLLRRRRDAGKQRGGQ